MEILNILEGYDLVELGFGTPVAVHLLAEAIGLAYADRFKYMGDPGYVNVPQRALVSKEYAGEQRRRINYKRAVAIEAGEPWPYEPECTTALTVADGDGNLVAVNQTLVNAFGCGVVIPGTGIVMNNAMYGLNPEPGTANSINGRKRRIQNVCPTILMREDKPYMALGAPGGRAIQVSIVHVIVNVVDHGMGIQQAIEAPRIMRETSTVYMDNRLPIEVKDALTRMGHEVAWIDEELYGWARPVVVQIDPETGLIHGGVHCDFTGFESTAIGY
jgi:gamma-glutamyltranspeptidase/glutathione hydrolase